MKARAIIFQGSVRGMTFIELMVSLAVGSVILAAVGALGLTASRAFVVLDNHARLDAQNRLALDIIGREVRQATAVVQWKTNDQKKLLVLTNEIDQTSTKFTWVKKDRVLTMASSGAPRQLLTGCDQWNFVFYTGLPQISAASVRWIPATNGAGGLESTTCRAVAMNWNCSRVFRQLQMNSEPVQGAPVVLRNPGR